MKSFMFLAFLALSSAASPPFRGKHRMFPDGRIIGGQDIDISEVPWQISLQYYGQHICGGSVIAAGWVVTAAHCTDGSTTRDLNVRAGTSTRESGGVEVDIARIHQNPQYDDWNIDWDISLLELASDLPIGASIGAVGLPSDGQTWSSGTDVLVTGWGTTAEDGNTLPRQLLGVSVQIVTNSACDAAYGGGYISDRMLCAGVSNGGKDACQGDSGGPLVAGSTLAGIVSWGYGCARAEYPGVYSNVGALRSYITDTAGL